MPIYRPRELVDYLNKLGISPKKRLSQNFLLDGNIIKKLVALADPEAEELIIEIGPGPGAITEELLKTGAKILAVEKDAALASGLKRLQTEKNQLEIFCEDILRFPLHETVKQAGKKCKLVANLPYHLTTPIITHFLPRNDLLKQLIVIVQEDVAKRFLATPGTKAYSSITVFIRFYSTPEFGFKVSPNCFFPKPKVNSAVVKFTLRPPPIEISEASFFHLTRSAFSKRRKMLSKTLGSLYPDKPISKFLEEMGKSSKCRPEELSLTEFLKLHKRLTM